jgi:hypothetical protein
MIRPVDDTFTDWCAARRHEADRLKLDGLPADEYFATLDEGHELLDRLDAALARKVKINAA